MTMIKPNEMNDSDDEEFQASSEDIDIKPWDLPYWKGAPKKDETEKKAEELEELEEVEVVEPLTVEDIEKIRNEAYEEGFLQGLNEGRDKGEKEGKEQGIALGKEEGLKQGQQEGNRIGFEAGEAEGLASGKQEIEQAAIKLSQLTQQLEQSLVEKDAAIPQVISQLIQSACKAVLERELEQGDNQITQKVLRALNELPGGAENIKIFVSSADALHLEHGLSSSGREMHFDIDESLVTGSARITTQQSLIEFSHQERMDKIFELVEMECNKLDLDDLAGEQVAESEQVIESEQNLEVEEVVETPEVIEGDDIEPPKLDPLDNEEGSK
jgi:flagellar assembly protein FliH